MSTSAILQSSLNRKLEGSSALMEKLRIDPHRALEPTRKKLTTLETQRVMGVLEETYKKAQITAAFDSICANVEDHKILLGRDLLLSMNLYTELQDEYDTLAGKVDATLGKNRAEEESKMEREEAVFNEDFWSRPKSSMSKSSRSSNIQSKWCEFTSEQIEEFREERNNFMARMRELIPLMQFHIRQALIRFRQNPPAISGVIEQASQRNIEQSRTVKNVLENVAKLKDIMMLRLMTTPAEHGDKMTFLHQVSEREMANRAIIEKLEQQLKTADEHMDNEIKAKNDVIRKLQADIHHISKFSEENIKRIQQESEKQKGSDEKNSEGKRHKLTQEMTTLKTQLTACVTEHQESELNLRRKKWGLENSVEGIIQKYDVDMGDRQKEFEEVDAVYTEEKKQLHELDERFKTLEVEYNQIMEERRIAEEKRQAELRELELLMQAATTIQSFWRSYKTRKQLRGKKGKKGGKGKGKGKKK